MSIACPQCKMFQTQGLSFYGNCQHCGWSFNDMMRKAQGTLKDDVHIASLANIIAQKDRRIAELEAEVALLKDQTKAKWKDAYGRICSEITEEGEG